MMTGAATFLLALLAAMMIPGVINRTRALMSGRRGPSIMQHVNNLDLLMRKGAVYSPTTTLLFRLAPPVYLGTALVAVMTIPIGGMEPLFGFRGDVAAFAYLLALGRIMLVLAAMDTGSSFEGMGASREALYGALIEPALFLVFGTLALATGYSSFSDIFIPGMGITPQMVIVLGLLAFAVYRIATVEAGRIPVDDPRTHLELTMIHEVMVLDYTGIDLGMITLGGWVKTGAFALLTANTVAIAFGLGWPVVLLMTVAIGVVIGAVESLTARNKLVRNSTYILITAAVGLILFIVTWLLQNNIEIG